MKLIVGLGNPGKKYENTRHNMGFLFVDYFADKNKIKLKKSGKAYSGAGEINGEKFILLKPETFMNLSGEAIQPVAAYNKIEVNDILIVHDDVDLPEFDLRIKRGGGDGGHNGLKSITEQLGNNYYIRIRFGVGRPPNPAMDTADWVLSALPANASDILGKKFETADKFITAWLTEGYEKAAGKFKDE